MSQLEAACWTLGEASRTETMERFIYAMDANLNPQQGDADQL